MLLRSDYTAQISAHNDMHPHGGSGRSGAEGVVADAFAVCGHGFDTFFYMGEVFYMDFIGRPAPDAAQGISPKLTTYRQDVEAMGRAGGFPLVVAGQF